MTNVSKVVIDETVITGESDPILIYAKQKDAQASGE